MTKMAGLTGIILLTDLIILLTDLMILLTDSLPNTSITANVRMIGGTKFSNWRSRLLINVPEPKYIPESLGA